MKTIVLFGSGNVATHLFRAFTEVESYRIIQVFNHKPGGLEQFKNYCDTTTDVGDIKQADIYLLAIKDDAISSVSEGLKFKNSMIIHTSGAVSLEVFKGFKNCGVFYPLQTFSKERQLNFNDIPICLEATHEAGQNLLQHMAGSISTKIYKINSNQRSSLHIAAVFVNNFVNYLYSEGEKMCMNNELPFDILHPLILETAKKATKMSPVKAQTGPAKRNDKDVIKSHLSKLDAEQQKIYNLLTQSILALHGKEL